MKKTPRQRFEQNKSGIRKIDSSAAHQPRKKRRRRSSAVRAALVFTVLVAAVVGVVLSLTVFFKIKSIDVYGKSIYSSSQIIEAGKIELDSNLIRLDSELIAKRIETALPYIEDVKVKKRLPTTVDLNITAAKTAGYIEFDGKYVIVSSEGKILDVVKKKPKFTTIDGIVLEDAKVAQYIKDEANSIEHVKDIYSLLGEGMSSGVTEINVSDSINLSFVYRDRVTVKLGSEANLKEKLKVVVLLLTSPEEIHEDDVGIIYASNPKRVSFLKKGSYSEMQQQLKEEQEKAEQNENVSSQEENVSSQNENISSETTENPSSDPALSQNQTSSVG